MKMHYHKLKLAPRNTFFLASICRANIDPPVTKIRLWASFGGCRSQLDAQSEDAGRESKNFFWRA